jgi:hypothetical protein
MNLIGQKVEANWGAMFPTVEGLIDQHIGQDRVIIKWDDGDRMEVAINDIHELGHRSPNGSPIGIFFGEVAA